MLVSAENLFDVKLVCAENGWVCIGLFLAGCFRAENRKSARPDWYPKPYDIL
jgi:hypothetical protein